MPRLVRKTSPIFKEIALSEPDIEGYIELQAPGGVVLVKGASAAGLAGIDTLIFDLDGVIIDPTNSILSAHPIAMKLWGETFGGLHNCNDLIEPTDVARFKLAGGFNDDWNIAAAVALVYCVKAETLRSSDAKALSMQAPLLRGAADGCAHCGGGVDGIREWLHARFQGAGFEDGLARWEQETPIRIFKEVVSGNYCPEMYGFQALYYKGVGTIARDRLLVDPAVLELPYRVGVYTGRTRGEVHIGLKITGLENWAAQDAMITVTDGMPKPHGKPLDILTQKLGTARGAFMGDNPDDLKSVLLYRSIGGVPMYSIQVCFGPEPERSRAAFLAAEADMIAPDTASALDALQMLREGNHNA